MRAGAGLAFRTPRGRLHAVARFAARSLGRGAFPRGATRSAHRPCRRREHRKGRAMSRDKIHVCWSDGAPESILPSAPRTAGNLAERLSRAGRPLNTRCGQRGLCGGCTVQLIAGKFYHCDGAVVAALTSELLKQLGNPYGRWPAVTVAGSKGKGSTAVLIAKLLNLAGERVGLITSPHLRRFNERIRVNGRCASDGELDDAAAAVAPFVRKIEEELEPM